LYRQTIKRSKLLKKPEIEKFHTCAIFGTTVKSKDPKAQILNNPCLLSKRCTIKYKAWLKGFLTLPTAPYVERREQLKLLKEGLSETLKNMRAVPSSDSWHYFCI